MIVAVANLDESQLNLETLPRNPHGYERVLKKQEKITKQYYYLQETDKIVDGTYVTIDD